MRDRKIQVWKGLAQADLEESPGSDAAQARRGNSGGAGAVSPETPEALQGMEHSRRSARASARKPVAVRAPMSASPTIPGPMRDLSQLSSGGGSSGRGKRKAQAAPCTAARTNRPRLSHGARATPLLAGLLKRCVSARSGNNSA